MASRKIDVCSLLADKGGRKAIMSLFWDVVMDMMGVMDVIDVMD